MGNGQTREGCPVVFTCSYIEENGDWRRGNSAKIARVWAGEALVARKLDFNAKPIHRGYMVMLCLVQIKVWYISRQVQKCQAVRPTVPAMTAQRRCADGTMKVVYTALGESKRMNVVRHRHLHVRHGKSSVGPPIVGLVGTDVSTFRAPAWPAWRGRVKRRERDHRLPHALIPHVKAKCGTTQLQVPNKV